jgi:hypothetical protein
MERITATEAIYGFASWLTCRKEAVTFSHEHDAAPAAELVDQYVKANGLPPVRNDVYPGNLTPPVNT